MGCLQASTTGVAAGKNAFAGGTSNHGICYGYLADSKTGTDALVTVETVNFGPSDQAEGEGVMTDLGISISLWLRRRQMHRQRQPDRRQQQ
jgi:hypothetical protein